MKKEVLILQTIRENILFSLFETKYTLTSFNDTNIYY